MAETYGILDYKTVKPSIVATLAVGLPESSRIKRKYSEIGITIEQMLLAMLVDGVNIGNWQRSGSKKSKKPISIFKKFTEKKKPKDELMSFRTPDEYEKWMSRKREKWNNG